MFNGFICQTTFGRAIYATTKNSLGRMEIISTGIDGTPVALAPGTIATRVVLSAQQAVESKESRLEICDVLHATHDPLVGLTLDLQDVVGPGRPMHMHCSDQMRDDASALICISSSPRAYPTLHVYVLNENH